MNFAQIELSDFENNVFYQETPKISHTLFSIEEEKPTKINESSLDITSTDEEINTSRLVDIAERFYRDDLTMRLYKENVFITYMMKRKNNQIVYMGLY